jgi:hypothetical protein
MSDLKIYSELRRIFVESGPYTEVDGHISVNGVGVLDITHVSVDGIITQNFRLNGANTLVVEGSASSEVIAYTDAPSDSETTLILGIPGRTKLTSSGADVLKQRVLKSLLSNEGSDAFTGLGAGLDDLAGSATGDAALTKAVSMVRAVERSLLESERPDEPLVSSLSHINILGARRDGEYNARLFVQIFNRAGESVETEVL